MHTSTIEATDPITALMEEHRLIERVLLALDRWAEQLDSGDSSVREDLPRFVEFLRVFADTQHHGKEEDVLFPAMTEAGLPADGGPIAVMLHEHDLGREYLAELGSPDSDQVTLCRAAREYGALLRQHIQKEDRILYPMARQLLGSELEAVGRRCRELEASVGPLRQRLTAMAAELTERYCRP